MAVVCVFECSGCGWMYMCVDVVYVYMWGMCMCTSAAYVYGFRVWVCVMCLYRCIACEHVWYVYVTMMCIYMWGSGMCMYVYMY